MLLRLYYYYALNIFETKTFDQDTQGRSAGGEEATGPFFAQCPNFGIFLGGFKVLMCMTATVIVLFPDIRLSECLPIKTFYKILGVKKIIFVISDTYVTLYNGPPYNLYCIVALLR